MSCYLDLDTQASLDFVQLGSYFSCLCHSLIAMHVLLAQNGGHGASNVPFHFVILGTYLLK
jgi:hypothetical protein